MVDFLARNTLEEPPQWPTGRELFVAASQWIYVGTICGIDGDVQIEVWSHELPATQGQLIYDGIIELPEDDALVGVYAADALESVPLGAGRHRIRVYTSPHDSQPDKVAFVID